MFTGEFKHESVQDVKSVKEYLHELKECFEKGEIIFKDNNEDIVLKPQGMIQFDLRAKKKDGKNKLYIKLSWKDNESFIEDNGNLIIK